MPWYKQDRLFNPANRFDWMQSYAQVPTPLVLEDRLRIYFATRSTPDASGRFISRIGFIDVDRDDPCHILACSDKPALSVGRPGCFDEFGVMPGYVRKAAHLDRVELYYTGWTRLTRVPYCTRIGKAVSYDGGVTFQRESDGPLLGLSVEDPLLINGPFVLQTDDGRHMWYASGREWVKTPDGFEIVYLIKHAFSADGQRWIREKAFCVPTFLENEAQNRPVVVKDDDHYTMWFSYREALEFREKPRAGYRLGCAVSRDLKNWERVPCPPELTLSAEGWDAEMMAYPYVLHDRGNIRLFYNGNYFGRDGFGYALWKG